MYETFDHTADLGLRIRAKERETLFAEAGLALMACLVDDLETIRPTDTESVEIIGTDPAYLLFDWLRELLLRFETTKMIYSRFDVKITGDGLAARLSGEPLDPVRHPLGHEVKAITYHALKCEQVDGEWLAEVIVDI